MHSEVTITATPGGVIEISEYLGNRSKKAQLENWLEEQMKQDLKSDDVSFEMGNPYFRISTKFDALSQSKQIEILEYIRRNIMVQKESLNSQLWTIMKNVRGQEGAISAMEEILDKTLIREHVYV